MTPLERLTLKNFSVPAPHQQLHLDLGLDEETSHSGETLQHFGGTFKDSMRSPIHRWFRYPAGFSNTFAYQVFREFGVKGLGLPVLDPFAGCATTLVAAREQDIPSLGTEAHPLVCWIGQTKLYWQFDVRDLRREVSVFLKQFQQACETPSIDLDSFVYPELIGKCFKPDTLKELTVARELIAALQENRPHLHDFLLLGLLAALRAVSHVGTANWQYILPRKRKKSTPTVYEALASQYYMMVEDLMHVKGHRTEFVPADLKQADARDLSCWPDDSVGFAFTSPPYLNNYDYADATRLEMYFLGMASTWGEITTQVRDNLIISATTQIRRADYDLDSLLSGLPSVLQDPLQPAIRELSEKRRHRGGKKDYDIMVGQYFNDMLAVLEQVYRKLIPEACFVLVLGDSAPYGVYVPTDELIGKAGLSVGFSAYRLVELRRRNVKWKNRKHRVPLRESVVVLKK